MYVMADESIGGRWRDLPILNMLKHPHEDSFRTFEEIVLNAGFHIEDHWVTTEDGYINKLYRINNYKSKKAVWKQNSAILMVHGLIDSSDAFILNGRNNS